MLSQIHIHVTPIEFNRCAYIPRAVWPFAVSGFVLLVSKQMCINNIQCLFSRIPYKLSSVLSFFPPFVNGVSEK